VHLTIILCYLGHTKNPDDDDDDDDEDYESTMVMILSTIIGKCCLLQMFQSEYSLSALSLADQTLVSLEELRAVLRNVPNIHASSCYIRAV